jgi:hypothetical protein
VEGFIWLRMEPLEDCHEHSNGPSDTIKDQEILDWLSDLPSQEGLCPMDLITSVTDESYLCISPHS